MHWNVFYIFEKVSDEKWYVNTKSGLYHVRNLCESIKYVKIFDFELFWETVLMTNKMAFVFLDKSNT